MVAAPSRSILRGTAFMLVTIGVFAVLDTTAKYLSQWYPVPAIVWARYAGSLVLVLALLAARGEFARVRTARPGTQLLRGLLLGASTLLYFTSLRVLPLADAAGIGFMMPVFIVLLAAPLLGERIEVQRLAAVLVGFAGALIIVRPGSSVFTWYALLPMGMALANALYHILTRKVAGLEPPATSLFYGALVGTLMFAPMVPFVWVMPATLAHWALFILMGVLAFVGHLALIRAFDYAPAGLLAPLIYTQLVWVMILGYVVFGDFPDHSSLAGMAVIVGSGLYLARRQRLVMRT